MPIEGVQESQILIGQFDAEFGRTSGAIVNAVTKSGTNQLHGAGFMFYTNKAMRAEDFFVDQNNLEEPDPTKQRMGRRPRRPDHQGQGPLLRQSSNGCRSTRAGRSRFRRGPT